jgi:hypothetical protein
MHKEQNDERSVATSAEQGCERRFKKIHLSLHCSPRGNIILLPSFWGGTKIRIALLNILNLLFLPVRTEALMIHFYSVDPDGQPINSPKESSKKALDLRNKNSIA